jgi:cytoskeletal protein CcmA (bactofilin family)
MWKKGDPDESGQPSAAASSPPAGTQARAARPRSEPATIGPSINIRGDVTGDEDLIIQGRIEGTVVLKKHNVTVGSDGKVQASIFGCTVTVEGQVDGDVRGEEQVVLRRSARVQGNISSPRVTLEDGARFRGGIDMGDDQSGGPRKAPPGPDQPAVESSKSTVRSDGKESGAKS